MIDTKSMTARARLKRFAIAWKGSTAIKKTRVVLVIIDSTRSNGDWTGVLMLAWTILALWLDEIPKIILDWRDLAAAGLRWLKQLRKDA